MLYIILCIWRLCDTHYIQLHYIQLIMWLIAPKLIVMCGIIYMQPFAFIIIHISINNNSNNTLYWKCFFCLDSWHHFTVKADKVYRKWKSLRRVNTYVRHCIWLSLLIVLYFSVSDPTAPSTPFQTNGEPHPNSRSPTPPGPTNHLHSVSQPELQRPSQRSEHIRTKEPPPLAPLAPLQDQSRLGEAPPVRRAPNQQHSSRPSLIQLKERPHGLNGLSDHSRSRPWESLSAEEFAQHFHQSVLQSTHKSQHKPKGERESDAFCCGKKVAHFVSCKVHLGEI